MATRQRQLLAALLGACFFAIVSLTVLHKTALIFSKAAVVVVSSQHAVTNNNDHAKKQNDHNYEEYSGGNGTISSSFVKEASSVDYFTCCGLGHRLSKMANANYVAKLVGFSLRVYWDWCDDKTPAFQHFFGTQPPHEFANVTSTGRRLQIRNESPGFAKLVRNKTKECMCERHVMDESARYYLSLRQRFRRNALVHEFQTENRFHDHTVIGLHVRAGNGETGDFARKNRGIQNQTEWTDRVKNELLGLSAGWTKPPMLFVATDTLSIVTQLRSLLDGSMPVVSYDQQRLGEGSGVAFGQKVHTNAQSNSACLSHMEDGLVDMMLLSHTDVLISGRPSSFTQGLPMSIVLDRPRASRAVDTTYCEFNPNATKLRCYEDIMEWCCMEDTSFHLEGIQRYEYLRVPTKLSMDELRGKIGPRITGKQKVGENCHHKATCIPPYDYDDP